MSVMPSPDVRALVTACLAVLEPPPRLTVSEWADRHRMLSPEASAEPGPWRTERAPYQRHIMDALTDPRADTVVLMTSAQVGKTEIVNNLVGYHMHVDPCPMLVVQPTLQMGEAWSKDRLAPMLRDTPALSGRVAQAGTRGGDRGNTLLHKQFPGGHLTIAGANSPASLASRPIRVLCCDEVDRYPPSAGGEGDPVSLAFRRTATFWNRRRILTSTPTVKGISRIEAAYEASTRERFHVPCPGCGHEQFLVWAQVQWEDGHPETARYQCERCEAKWTDARRWAAIRKCRPVAENPGSRVRGFHLSEIYSSWTRLGDMARDFVEAKQLPETLRAWVNMALGETYEETAAALSSDLLYRGRREAWTELPEAALVLTAGVDVQEDRLEAEVVAWSAQLESWQVEYRVLYGDPADPSRRIWRDLDALLAETTWPREDGVRLRVAAAAIDSGHHTDHVYAYCLPRYSRLTFAIKGRGGAGLSAIANVSRVRPPHPSAGCQVFSLGVDGIKSVVYSRLAIEEPGPGYCHYPRERDETYFERLVAERPVTRWRRGRPTIVWELPSGRRNEPLDCRVYACAALEVLQPAWEAVGARLLRQREVEPEPQPTDAVLPRRPQTPGRSRGWVGSWR